MTLLDTLNEFATRRPDAPFLIEGSISLSYSETRRQSRRIASGLINLGLQPGERVILSLHNCLEFCTALYGIQWAGGTAVLVNPRLTAYEINNAWELTQPRFTV